MDLKQPGNAALLAPLAGALALAAVVVASAGSLGTIELSRKSAHATEQAPMKVGEKPANSPAAMPDAIEILVLGRDTNRPLERARIRASLDLEEPILNTDSEGRVRIDLSKVVFRDRFGVDVWADGYVQQRYYFGFYDSRNPTIPDRLTIALLPGEETLGGKVTNEEGRPISRARVVLWGYLEKKEPHESGYMFDTYTDANGEWRCRSCRKMTFAYLYLSHPQYVADEHSQPRLHGKPEEGKPYSPDDPTMKPLRDFTDVQIMKRGVALEGTVTDTQGRPIAGAEVGRLEANHRSTFWWDMPRTVTDAAGRFQFAHVGLRTYVLQVKAQGHAPELKSVMARQGAKPVAIELGPAHLLSGRIVDTQRKPIENAYVYITGWRGSQALGVNLRSDGEGRFRWDDAPSDELQIALGCDGYDGASLTNVPGRDGEVLVTFKRVLSVSGALTDALTKKPIEQGVVEVASADPAGGFSDWSPRNGTNIFRGNFNASLDAETVTDYRLRIKVNGYEIFESRPFKSDERKVVYNVVLTRSTEAQRGSVSVIGGQPHGKPSASVDSAITRP